MERRKISSTEGAMIGAMAWIRKGGGGGAGEETFQLVSILCGLEISGEFGRKEGCPAQDRNCVDGDDGFGVGPEWGGGGFNPGKDEVFYFRV